MSKEWIWNGAIITAEEGESYEFVNRLVDTGEAYSKAMELALELSEGLSFAYSYIKSFINGSANNNSEYVLRLV